MNEGNAVNDEDLVQAIQNRAGLRSADEARRLFEGVLQALAYVLPAEQCDAICACVPEDAAWCLRCGPATPDPLIDSDVFVGWAMASVDATGAPDETLGGADPLAALAAAEVQARVRVVLEALWERLEPPSRAGIEGCLPGGIAEMMNPGSSATRREHDEGDR
ncbi:MAG: hypothetical protein CMQ43_03405 [Gammaproteobacteria bacterium]|nr:hypothetical protein [Gammaproteobacteria bacterium]